MNAIRWHIFVAIFLAAALTVLTPTPIHGQSNNYVFVYRPIMWRQTLHLLPTAYHLPEDEPHSTQAAQQALDALLRGRGESPNSFIANIFPSGAKVNSVDVSENKITVDFSPHTRNLNVGAHGEWIAVQAIVHTAQAAAGLSTRKVRIEIDGSTVDTLGGHILVGDPLEADEDALWPGEDAKNQHWAQLEILSAEMAGLITAKDPVKPDEHITRREFIRMCVKAVNPDALGEPGQTFSSFPNPFSDVAQNSPLARWIRAVIAEGLLRPSDYSHQQRFMLQAEEPITRREVLVISARLARQVLSVSKAEDMAVGVPGQKYPDWLKVYVNEAHQLGVLRGYPDQSLRLESPATRAESVSMLLRAAGMIPHKSQSISVLRPGIRARLSPGQLVMGTIACGERGQIDCRIIAAEHDPVQVLAEIPPWPDSHPLHKSHNRAWFAFEMPQMDYSIHQKDSLLMCLTCSEGGRTCVPLKTEERLTSR